MVYDNDEIEVRSVRPRLRRLAIIFYPLRWLFSRKITTIKIEELKEFVKHYETIKDDIFGLDTHDIEGNPVEYKVLYQSISPPTLTGDDVIRMNDQYRRDLE